MKTNKQLIHLEMEGKNGVLCGVQGRNSDLIKMVVGAMGARRDFAHLILDAVNTYTHMKIHDFDFEKNTQVKVIKEETVSDEPIDRKDRVN